MPSDYNLSSKDQVDILVNGLDKKELNNLAEIVQNITNRKETVFFFDEKVYKSAINEFSFMLDQKTFIFCLLNLNIVLINKSLIEKFQQQIINYVDAVKKIYTKKKIIGVLIYLDETVFMDY